MSNQTGRSIRAQLMWLSLIIVTVSVALSPGRHPLHHPADRAEDPGPEFA